MRETSGGFTLVEVLIAMVLVAITVIALAPLFVHASRESSSAGEWGDAGALAVQRMEILRAAPFSSLADGGSLDANVAGYFDIPDSSSVVRWTVADKPGGPAGAKVLTVRATAAGPPGSPPRHAELHTVRSD